MIITYHGKQFFKIQLGNLVIAYNPPSKSSDTKSARFGADIAIGSFGHPDFNGFKEVSYGDREPFVIFGPGEYEVEGTFIQGFGVNSEYDKIEGVNAVYEMGLENMNLVFLGALSKKDLPENVLGSLDDIGILFISVGGPGLMSPAEAAKLAVKLEPKIIIPMGFTDLKDANLKTFLKESGGEDAKAEDKLTIKRKDLDDKAGDIRLLTPQV